MLHASPIYFSRFEQPNSMWSGVHIIWLVVMWLFSLPCHLVPLRPTYLPQHPIVEHSAFVPPSV
jgi:hypothetical protein